MNINCANIFGCVLWQNKKVFSLPSGLENAGFCNYEGFSLHRPKFYSPVPIAIGRSDILFNVTLSEVEGPLKRFSEKPDER